MNGANLSVGDKVIIGFLNNSIYDVIVYGALDKTIHDDSKQDLLISGSNIKTVNNESLLGSGNITIQGGSNVDIVTSWETTPSDTKVASEKLTKDTLDTKQATLVSGSNIKTVNSTTLLGSGDISIPAGEDGSLFWTTTTAPTTPNYTFTISNLAGETGKTPKKGDIIFYSYYRYTVDTVGETTLKATPRQSIRGATGAAGANGTNGADGDGIVTDFYIDSETDEWVIETAVCSQGEVVTSFSSTLTDTKVPSEKLIKEYVDDLVGDAILYINGNST